MYGYTQINEDGHMTSAICSVDILGSPVMPCTLGVHLRECTRSLTNLRGALIRKRHFRTPAVWISTVSQIT